MVNLAHLRDAFHARLRSAPDQVHSAYDCAVGAERQHLPAFVGAPADRASYLEDSRCFTGFVVNTATRILPLQRLPFFVAAVRMACVLFSRRAFCNHLLTDKRLEQRKIYGRKKARKHSGLSAPADGRVRYPSRRHRCINGRRHGTTESDPVSGCVRSHVGRSRGFAAMDSSGNQCWSIPRAFRGRASAG